MTIFKNSDMLTAAFSGLLGGTMASLNVAPAGSSNPALHAGRLSTTMHGDKDTYYCGYSAYCGYSVRGV